MHTKTEQLTQSEKILTAAFHCISTKGYANVSLRDIANEAGVVLSQLNYYYKNKEGLFSEVIKVVSHKYLMDIKYHLQKDIPNKDKVSSLIQYSQKMLNKNPKLFRLLYDFISMSIWSDSLRELFRQLFQDLSDLIEKHALIDISLNKNLKDYSLKAIARMIIGAMFGVTIQCIIDPEKENLSDALNIIPVVFQ